VQFKDFYGPGRFGLSFEIYPPKTPAGEEQLMAELARLVRLRPNLVTCTYGAGGSTRDQTLELTVRIRERFGLPTASHFTCVGSSRAELEAWLGRAWAAGIRNIVALRGDPPRGQDGFRPAPDGLAHADELVALIRRRHPAMSLAVAGYPETHREAPSPEADLAHLKRKVEAGADVVITQLFYDNRDFFDFRRRYEAAGIRAPLVPGILPVTGLAQIKKIASLCGARLPAAFEAELRDLEGDPEAQLAAGVAQAARQCGELLAAGVPGLHFYVLNKAEATLRILTALGFPRAPVTS
jgi:methylenetetrahydrofolate reductase (NADPH)